MNKQLKGWGKNLLTILFFFLVIATVFSLFTPLAKDSRQVSFSQLAQDINDGKVKKIIANGQDLTVEYQNDKLPKYSRKESEVGLSQSFQNYGVSPENFKRVDITLQPEKESAWVWVGPVLFNVIPLLIIGWFILSMFKQSRQSGGQVFDFSKAKAKLFDKDKTREKIGFEEVGGLTEAKEELREVVDFLKNPQKFIQIGARVPRGVLLVGSTGTGKTLLARAVANEANVPFYSISGSEFIELFVGVGAARVRDLFETAKKHQPCIIFIDELDAIGGTRSPGFGGGHEEREQTLNQILVEMDGFDKDSTCIVLAATNRPDILDAALLRPGRFDRRVVFDMPDVKSREHILKIHCEGKQMDDNIDLAELSERTPGFSGADLSNLVNEAAILAVKHNKTKVSQKELLESIDKVLLGPERKTHLLNAREKEISAYHEAGHAIVNTLVPNGQDVRKVSIISRGMAGGYTLTLPKEERHFKTKTEFVSEIATLLGGYCAEKIIFNEITTGAGNDLEVASDIARALVKDYGMSELGPITFGKTRGLAYLNTGYNPEDKNYSEKISERIDAEVEKIVKDAQIKAAEILQDKKELLNKIALLLIKKETIEKEEFEELMKEEKIVKAKVKKLKE